jgi:predicted membrane channel-forming protein YqfA (hemolysin III family)
MPSAAHAQRNNAVASRHRDDAGRHTGNANGNDAPAVPSYVLDLKDSTLTTLRMSDPQLVPPARGEVPPASELSSGQPQRRSLQPNSSAASSSSADSWWTRVQREVASWRCGTVSIHDVDPWLQFNVYVRRGFRHCRLRKREAVGSIFLYLHNETFNIVSHLLATLVMLSLLWWPPRAPVGGDEAGSSSVVGVGAMHDLYEHTSWAGSPTEDSWRAPRGSSSYSPSSSSPLNRKDPRRSGSHVGQKEGKEDVFAPTQRWTTPQQAPSWLRGLHGLLPTNPATSGRGGAEVRDAAAATLDDWDEGEGDGRAYVPPGGAASPRSAPGMSGTPSSPFSPSPPMPSSSWMPFLLPRFFSGFSSPSMNPTAADIVSDAQAPISVAARLDGSLHPLTWCFALTFVLSCVYHTFMPCCRSRRGYQQLLQCDVMGVLLSMSGSAYAYLTCGMPCASASTLRWAAGLVMSATLLCLYVVVLAPMWSLLAYAVGWAWAVGQWMVAWLLCALMEFMMSAPIPVETQSPRPPSPQPPQQRALERGGRLELRGRYKNLPAPAQPTVACPALYRWLQRHRHAAALFSCSTTSSSPAAEQASHNSPAEPVHITARQRAVTVGVYCLLHLSIYRWLVYPKSHAAFGGFTQGVHYHNLTYLWLFVGGALNAARFPERVVFHWTRKAAKHTRALAAEEAAAWCSERLSRDSSDVAGTKAEQPVVTTSWWRRFSLPRFMVTYVVSASTLDYIGNSHNLWHVCTSLSAFSNLLAVYYDCMEYDLVVCA